MATLLQIALEAGMLALAVLLGVCALIGSAVALKPALMGRVRRAMERRVSMRRATRRLDIPRNADRIFYRHHRLYGAAVVLLAIFLLSVLAFGDTDRWAAVVSLEYRMLAAMLFDAARIVLWILGLFALMVGTIVFVRPSALKRLERSANRWLTPRRYTYPLEREYSGLDTRLARSPRTWGTIVALLSVACMIALLAQWQALA